VEQARRLLDPALPSNELIYRAAGSAEDVRGNSNLKKNLNPTDA
jgi:hypothetical protein